MIMSTNQLEEFLRKASRVLGLDYMKFVVIQDEDSRIAEIEITCSYDSVFTVDCSLDDVDLKDLPKSIYIEATLYNDAEYGYEVCEDTEELQWFAEKLQELISSDDWDFDRFIGAGDEDSGVEEVCRVVRFFVPKDVRVEIITHDRDSVEVTME